LAEQINDMIQSKKALAEMTVSTGENRIGNMSNKEFVVIIDKQIILNTSKSGFKDFENAL